MRQIVAYAHRLREVNSESIVLFHRLLDRYTSLYAPFLVYIFNGSWFVTNLEFWSDSIYSEVRLAFRSFGEIFWCLPCQQHLTFRPRRFIDERVFTVKPTVLDLLCTLHHLRFLNEVVSVLINAECRRSLFKLFSLGLITFPSNLNL